jgi:protein phosphatase
VRHRPGNAQHIGRRAEQQDAFAFSDLDDDGFRAHGGVLAVVADGMGGLADGAAASTIAVRVVLEAYCRKAPQESVSDALTRALQQANATVVEFLRTDGRATAGAAVAAVVLHEGRLHWRAAGDSRVYLWRAGLLEAVTLDHVYAVTLAERVAAGTLSPAEADAHPDRDTLTSFLGRDPLPAVDASWTPLPLRADDLVLLCTDGVYRPLGEAGLRQLCARHPDPQVLCEQAVAAVLERGWPDQDNCTILAVSSRAASERPADAHR